MNVTSCVNAGFYKSITDDWLSAMMTTSYTIGLVCLGTSVGVLHAFERKLQGSVHRLEQSIQGLGTNDRQEEENALRQIKESLVKVKRMKQFTFGVTVATSAVITQYYGAIGCPGFDYWSEVKNQVRRFWPSATRLPLVQQEL
jgi:hypothetical protein